MKGVSIRVAVSEICNFSREIKFVDELKCIETLALLSLAISDRSSSAAPFEGVLGAKYFHSFLIEGGGLVLSCALRTKFMRRKRALPRALLTTLK